MPETSRGHTNNFNVLRLAAAWLVLFSHSFPLTASREPFAKVFGYLTGGDIAVSTFFLISGYLVTRSALARPLLDFAMARALRILPALAVVVVFDILVIGLLFTTLTLAEYFTHPWTVRHLGNIYVYGLSSRLPGTFESLPNHSVNGSLWTLPLEVSMYIIIGALAALGMRSRSFALAFVALFAIALAVATVHFGLGWGQRGPRILPSVQAFPFLRYGFLFFLGAAFVHWREKIPLRGDIAIGACALLALSAFVPLGAVLYYVALPYLVFYIALATPAVPILRNVDLSYGMYLFAFPVQQSIVQIAGKGIGPWWLAISATAVVVSFAMLSWHMVEKPALALKDAWGSDVRRSAAGDRKSEMAQAP